MKKNLSGIICPYCKESDDSEVLETRSLTDCIRRRRSCSACNERYTTYEILNGDHNRLIQSEANRKTYKELKTFLDDITDKIHDIQARYR